jgi:phage shock protein A
VRSRRLRVGVKKRNVDALRAAMQLLLAGNKRLTNGALTWTNVHTEANVPRATANRAVEVKQEWTDALRELARAESAAGDGVRPGAEQGGKDDDEEDGKSKTIRGLRETIRIMADHIQALTVAIHQLEVAIKEREATIEILHHELASSKGSNIIPLPVRT